MCFFIISGSVIAQKIDKKEVKIDIYAYATDYVSSLEVIQLSMTNLMAAKTNLDVLTQLRISNNNLNIKILQINKYKNQVCYLLGKEYGVSCVDTKLSLLSSMVDENNSMIEIINSSKTNKDDDFSKVIAHKKYVLESLSYNTMMLVSLFRSGRTDSEGKANYTFLTDEQREQLKKSLISIFGDKIKVLSKNLTDLEMSGATIYGFCNGQFIYDDTTKKK